MVASEVSLSRTICFDSKRDNNMASINEVTIMGNLGRDPELRRTKNDTPVATLNIATTRKWTDKTTGEVTEDTEWHRVVVWGPAAASVAKHKKKGDQILVRGYLQTREYTDKDDVKRWSTEIVAGSWSPMGVVFTGRAEGGGTRPSHPADDPNLEPPNDRYMPGDPGDDNIPF